jgi:hypothetical protein
MNAVPVRPVVDDWKTPTTQVIRPDDEPMPPAVAPHARREFPWTFFVAAVVSAVTLTEVVRLVLFR